MKNILKILPVLYFLHAVFPTTANAQNEVKLNIANTIAIASIEVGYENFLDFSQSLEGEIHINDRMNYGSERGSRKFNTTSFKLGYNYYFGEETAGSGIYVNPFAKFRTGDFRETITEQENGVEVINTRTTDMSSFMIGIGGGYKWNFNDSFVFGPYANIARNFSEEVRERFTAVEFNAGFSVGYRF